MPEPAVTQPIDLSNAEASAIASKLNTDSHLDAYGASWSQYAVISAHANGDPNQRKRLLYLLFLYTQAVG